MNLLTTQHENSRNMKNALGKLRPSLAALDVLQILEIVGVKVCIKVQPRRLRVIRKNCDTTLLYTRFYALICILPIQHPIDSRTKAVLTINSGVLFLNA